ncbi:MAG: hypothetical protein PHS95_00905 [Candidatus Pacebacteria bacterium]|nr:hypothetical protein [Candidatus Paceibacterota bacterium]
MENTQKVVLAVLIPASCVSSFILGVFTDSNEFLSMAILLSLLTFLIACSTAQIVEAVSKIVKLVKAKIHLSKIVKRIQAMNPEYQECLEVMEARKANYAVYWKMLSQI